jgi:hypothetical protein
VPRKRSNYKKLAEALDEAARCGNPVRDVLLANGYSQSVANQGWAAVPTRALKLMKGHSKGKRFRELGKSLPATEQAALVRGALISNIQEGEDKGIQSIKALGSTRELSMFTPDVQVGVVILGEPPRLPGMTAEESKRAMLEGAAEEP